MFGFFFFAGPKIVPQQGELLFAFFFFKSSFSKSVKSFSTRCQVLTSMLPPPIPHAALYKTKEFIWLKGPPTICLWEGCSYSTLFSCLKMLTPGSLCRCPQQSWARPKTEVWKCIWASRLCVPLGGHGRCASRRARQVETTPGSGARPKTPALGNGVQTFQTSQLQHQTPFSVSVSR